MNEYANEECRILDADLCWAKKYIELIHEQFVGGKTLSPDSRQKIKSIHRLLQEVAISLLAANVAEIAQVESHSTDMGIFEGYGEYGGG